MIGNLVLAKKKAIGTAALFLAGLSIACLAGVAATRELEIFIARGRTIEARFDSLERSYQNTAYSTYSDKVLLLDCREALAALYGRMQGGSRRAKVAATCRDLARAILASNPTSSLAWAVLSEANLSFGDSREFNVAIQSSAKSAPNELWLASLRIQLAFEGYQLLDGQTALNLKQDIASAAQSSAGVAWLAQFYVRNPKSRDVILSEIESLPSDVRKNFLRAVQEALSVQDYAS